MIFKSWHRIVLEHKILADMIKELNQIQNCHCAEWNSKKAPLLREENKLRDSLSRSTEKEKIEIEKRIEEIQTLLKPLEDILNQIENQIREKEKNIRQYMIANLTEKELKKAKQHGWEI